MDKITYFCVLLMIAVSSQVYYVDEDATIIFEDINIEEEMKKAEIIPDVLPRGPKTLLRVRFPHQPDLIPGQRLYYSQYMMMPEFFYDYENETYYTMYMTRLTRYADTQEYFTIDPYYNRTYGRDETGYWIIVNIWENYTFAGRILIDYEAPMDQFDRRTVDRYAMFLFKQQYEITELPEPEERSIYLYGELPKTAQFAKKYGLGEPLAAVDRYTFLLYKQKFKIRDYWLPHPAQGDYYRPGDRNESRYFAKKYRFGDPIAANFFIMHW